ncbi:MAG: hypothetical protein GXY86_16230 [Firmicutes bacterium]|nr:hypothetical protein [Bacillota bacterium]
MGMAKVKVVEELTIENLVGELIDAKGERVILEVAEGTFLLHNEVNLRLLKFYAEEEEKEIIIDTNDAELIGLAHQVGISTKANQEPLFFKDKHETETPYQRAKIEIAASPETNNENIDMGWIHWPGRLQLAMVFALFSLVLACWWVLQPRAVILVYPKEQTLNFSTVAQIGTTFNSQELLAGKIPAKILVKDNRIKVQTVVTGSKIVGVTPAVGKLTLINNTNQPVVLPKESVGIGKAGVRFLTDRDVLVPKRHTKYQDGIAVGEEYGRAEVSITAEKKGTIGNQPAKSITTLDGKHQRFLKVINSTPTKNGADKRVAVVTLNDVKKGETEAKRQMQLVGNEEISGLTGQEYLFLPELTGSEIIRVVNEPNIGAESELVETSLDYRISILTPLTDDISKYLIRKFEESIPEGFQPATGQVALTAINIGPMADNKAQLKLNGKGMIKGVLDAGKLKDLIKGKTKDEATDLLTQQNEVAHFKINLKNNAKRIPNYLFQIKVVFPAGGQK